jgi:branched-chain amino acid transport system ATP-binding protein
MGEGKALLDLRGLVKRYAALTATDLSLTVERGEIHALIGPNGAGKTTLVHQISGALAPDEGRILFDGRDVTRVSMHERVARGLARSYQITNIFRRCSVLDNLALAVQARRGSSMRFWEPAIEDREVFDEARALAHRVGLGVRVDARAGELAHGEQRKLEVGLALATRPKLLLLDEPMAGMGSEGGGLVPLIESLRRETTVLLIEHDMDAVFQLADRISVLVTGRILATGSPAEIRANGEVQRAYLGDEATA